MLQSYLFRSEADLAALLPCAPNVRIVKGAYLEPPDVAYARKRDVDASYLKLAELALSHDGYTAIATHDPQIIDWTKEFAAARGLPKRGRFEFQMLYGIAEPLARRLVERGYRVRLSIPYGEYWFPYLMRRLAERPANLTFFVRSIFDAMIRSGIWAAVLTPVDADLLPDAATAVPYYRSFCCGVATESTCWERPVKRCRLAPNNGCDSWKRLRERPADGADDGWYGRRLAGRCRALTRHAFECGFAAAFIMPPFFFRDASHDGHCRIFRRALRARESAAAERAALQLSEDERHHVLSRFRRSSVGALSRNYLRHER